MAEAPARRQDKERGAAEYDELEGEYKACQQQLRSKEQALRILQEQLKKADLNSQRLKQEIKQLRSQLSRSQQALSPVTKDKNPFSLVNEELVQEKEVLIQQLERSQVQISELDRQVQQLQDDKEEMEGERDHFSSRCDGLVKCLEEERTRQPPSHYALQTVLEENRQLKLALVEVEAEREHARGKMERYRRAIERRKIVEAAGEQIVINSDKKQDLKLAVKRISELESLANSLSQSVKEKSVTITHQKAANKVLAKKVTELEHQLRVVEGRKCLKQILSTKASTKATVNLLTGSVMGQQMDSEQEAQVHPQLPPCNNQHPCFDSQMPNWHYQLPFRMRSVPTQWDSRHVRVWQQMTGKCMKVNSEYSIVSTHA